MARRSFAERVADVVAEYTPASPIGAELVRSYLPAITSHGSVASHNHEIELLRALCRMVEARSLDVLSVAALESLLHLPATSTHQQWLRGKVIRRVIRILQENGELPSARDLHYDRKLQHLLASAAAHARDQLRRWLARRHGVGRYELFHEARRLLVLEAVLAANPMLDDTAAIAAWLTRLVRPVAACACPPVTRADSGDCAIHGGSPDQARRPSPGPKKQAELRSLGRKYLAQRRIHSTATRCA